MGYRLFTRTIIIIFDIYEIYVTVLNFAKVATMSGIKFGTLMYVIVCMYVCR